jgi:hypothetical protein
MKWQVLVVAFAFSMLGACGFHTKEQKPSTPSPVNTPQTDGLNAHGLEIMSNPKFKESLGKIEHGNYEMGERLEPGSIVFSGTIASETTNQAISVDKRVVINLESRLNFTRTISDEEIAVMSELTDLKTYINFGCGHIDPTLVEGLTRIEPKIQHDFQHVHAKKVFVCGKHIVNEKSTIFYAEELMLNEASFGFSKGGGIINFCAKTLTLNGETRLFTNVKKVDSLDQPGSPVLLSVIDKLKGEGTLKINQP